MTAPRALRAAARVVAARVVAAYEPPSGAVACEAFGGPCDGRRWLLPQSPAPIWLAAGDGRRHLYVPAAAGAVRPGVAPYRYVASADDGSTTWNSIR